MSGNLDFRYGAMNSGKSTDVIQMAYNYREKGHQVLVVKPSIDTKGEHKIVSRIGASVDANLLLGPNQMPSAIIKSHPQFAEIRAIIIDEAQFLSPVQVEDFWKLTAETDINVIAFGLRTDFLNHGFPGSTRLLELADKTSEIATVCRCGRKARCNTRKVNGTFVFSGDQVAIDGEDKVAYEPLCKVCYAQEQQLSV